MRIVPVLGLVVIVAACGGSTGARPEPDGGLADVVEVAPGSAVACPDVRLPAERPPDGTPLPAGVRGDAEPRWAMMEAALAAGDEDAVLDGVCEVRRALGDWQGVAEAPGGHLTPGPVPDGETLRALYLAALEENVLGQEDWVKVGGSTDGTDLSVALRTPCGVVAWYLAVLPVAGDLAPRLEAAARAGLDWLLDVQRPEGHFPFPDLTDDWDRFLAACVADGGNEASCFARAPRLLQLAAQGERAWEEAGSPPGVLVDGWFVDDAIADPGGLQFDTGICGVTLAHGAARFDDPSYLDAARRAAAWAADQPVVSNWNYNAFSVDLIAAVARVDDAPPRDWAAAALAKARVGVLPGALPDGRWVDPHNARIVYHHILLRGLARLAAVADDPWLDATLDVARQRSVDELVAEGAAGIDDGIEAHVILADLGRGSEPALDVLVGAATRTGRVTAGGVAYVVGATRE